MSKLKPCPFCGEQKNVFIKTTFDIDDCIWKHVECLNCGGRTRGDWYTGNNDCPIFYEGVRDEWNKRINKSENL